MPKDHDQNEIPEEESANTYPDKESSRTRGGSSQEDPPRSVNGTPNNALLRTFRDDISKNAAPQHASRLMEALTPKRAESQPTGSAGNQDAPEKGKNEAIVHTFKDDVQHLVRNRKMSMTRIAALEADRDGGRTPAQEHREPWKTTFVIALTVLFLVIGSVLAVGAFYAYRLNSTPAPAPQSDPAIIFTEARESVDVTDKSARSIMTTLANARRSILFSLGSIVELYPTRTLDTPQDGTVVVPVDAIDFLESIEADVPETFLQTLSSEYVLGVHVIDENVPFLILTTQSYGYAFAGMLTWEKNMEANLVPFFSPDTEYVKPATAEGESSFSDTVIQNMDVRLLRDSEENIRLLYSFVNRGTMIITTNVRTLIELANRIRVAEI